jgi:hypothetical protein
VTVGVLVSSGNVDGEGDKGMGCRFVLYSPFCFLATSPLARFSKFRPTRPKRTRVAGRVPSSVD